MQFANRRHWHERAGFLNRDWKIAVRAKGTTKMDVVKIPAEKLTKCDD